MQSPQYIIFTSATISYKNSYGFCDVAGHNIKQVSISTKLGESPQLNWQGKLIRQRVVTAGPLLNESQLSVCIYGKANMKIGLCILIQIFGILGISGGLEAAQKRLTLTGSSTIAPLAQELGKRFEKSHGSVRVDVQTGGSSRGISDARQKLADIGMVSRSLHADEADLKSHTIALDGVAVIVHKTNPVSSLTKDQLISIYSRKTVNWKEVDGNDATITVVSKAAGRSTLELFLDYLGLKSSEIKPHIIIGDNEQGIKTVLGNPQAIGYVSIGTAEFQASQGTPIKLLPLENVAASVANVKAGSYPLARPLNFVTQAGDNALAKEFLAFALSPAAADLIKEQYFVPVEIRK